MKGIFITMEGPDGSGKTTQIERLKAYLSDKGYDIIITREPGGTSISEKIREVILDCDNKSMCDTTEMLLYAASRAQLIHEVIEPALLSGKIVISDRFVDSSAVYQGIARGLSIDAVYDVNQYALNGIEPDITILLDLDAKEGIKRKKDQTELDRMEMEKISFHEKVAQGYRDLAKRHPNRIITIDAFQPIEDIHNKIVQYVEKKL